MRQILIADADGLPRRERVSLSNTGLFLQADIELEKSEMLAKSTILIMGGHDDPPTASSEPAWPRQWLSGVG